MYFDVTLSLCVLDPTALRQAAFDRAIYEGNNHEEAERYLSDEVPLEECVYMALLNVPDGCSMEDSEVVPQKEASES